MTSPLSRVSRATTAGHVATTAYRLLDAGRGERLEQWGPYRLRRPDPRATGSRARADREWRAVDAWFRGEAGRGRWERLTDVPARWTIAHGGVTLIVKLAPFKHTGVFPEQAEHWRWMTRVAAAATVTAAAGGLADARGRADGDARAHADREARAEAVARVDADADADAAAAADADAGMCARAGAGDVDTDSPRRLEILNLFAYTGGATMALARAGHQVTHVDASKPALAWARENAAANGLDAHAVRWIQDDAAAFVRRERRRGRRYDAALMDPPAFGHAPRGGVWRVDDQLAPLIADTIALLADPVFFLVNLYARGADARSLAPLVAFHDRDMRMTHGQLQLRMTDGRRLDTGVYARWQRR